MSVCSLPRSAEEDLKIKNDPVLRACKVARIRGPCKTGTFGMAVIVEPRKENVEKVDLLKRYKKMGSPNDRVVFVETINSRRFLADDQ